MSPLVLGLIIVYGFISPKIDHAKISIEMLKLLLTVDMVGSNHSWLQPEHALPYLIIVLNMDIRNGVLQVGIKDIIKCRDPNICLHCVRLK